MDFNLHSEIRRRKITTIALFGEWDTTNLGDQAIGLATAKMFLALGLKVRLYTLGSLRCFGSISDENYTAVFQQLHKNASMQSRKKKVASVTSCEN